MLCGSTLPRYLLPMARYTPIPSSYMKGATPVPGPSMMTGASSDAGGRNAPPLPRQGEVRRDFSRRMH